MFSYIFFFCIYSKEKITWHSFACGVSCHTHVFLLRELRRDQGRTSLARQPVEIKNRPEIYFWMLLQAVYSPFWYKKVHFPPKKINFGLKKVQNRKFWYKKARFGGKKYRFGRKNTSQVQNLSKNGPLKPQIVNPPLRESERDKQGTGVKLQLIWR